MGDAQKKKGERLRAVGAAVLAALAMGTLVVAAVAAPNVITAFAPLVGKRRKANRRSLERAVKRLREEGYIRWITKEKKTYLEITRAGKKALRIFELETMRLTIPERWDRTWSIILYDIPNTKKVARDALRQKLRSLGCFQFHKSVFVHPSDCRDEVDFLTELFRITSYVSHFRTSSLGRGEERARRFFDLP